MQCLCAFAISSLKLRGITSYNRIQPVEKRRRSASFKTQASLKGLLLQRNTMPTNRNQTKKCFNDFVSHKFWAYFFVSITLFLRGLTGIKKTVKELHYTIKMNASIIFKLPATGWAPDNHAIMVLCKAKEIITWTRYYVKSWRQQDLHHNIIAVF